MSETITVDELTEKLNKLKKVIGDIVINFHSETGIKVTDITPIIIDSSSKCGNSVMVSGVDITVSY